MSELAVGSLKGLAANDFVIDVAAGSRVVQPGAILQVIEATSGTVLTTTTGTFQGFDLSATITPSSTDNKILAFVSVGVRAAGDNYNRVSFSVLDSPETTSATTYSVEGNETNGNAGLRILRDTTVVRLFNEVHAGSTTMNFNNSTILDGNPGVITLMEVAG